MRKGGQKLDLDRKSAPKSEAADFERDQAALDAQHNRRMADKQAEQGPIGRWIGSSDSSLNVCFIILLLIFAAIGITLFTEGLSTVFFDGLIALASTVIGYIMGNRQRN